MEIDIGLWAAVGFIFAAYAVVGNDALQNARHVYQFEPQAALVGALFVRGVDPDRRVHLWLCH